MTEKEKYDGMYESTSYGIVNNGKDITNYVCDLKADSICDVGCGDGSFCRSLLDDVKHLYGIDISSSPQGSGIWWSKGYSKELPLPDNAVDYVTSFDMLEHLPTDEVDPTLDEFARIAKYGMILSISYDISARFYNGHTLHLTVKPEGWWVNKLSKYGTVIKQGKYLLVNLL